MNNKHRSTPIVYIQASQREAAEALAEMLSYEAGYDTVIDGRLKHDFTVILDPEHKNTAVNSTTLVIVPPIKPAMVIEQTKSMIENFDENQVSLGKAMLDLKARMLIRGTKAIRLTEKECAVLLYLRDCYPQAADRDDLLKNVWGYAQDIDTHTIETHIYRLRQKIEDDPSHAQILVTDKQGGYMLGQAFS